MNRKYISQALKKIIHLVTHFFKHEQKESVRER
jgi:hypothetical protein